MRLKASLLVALLSTAPMRLSAQTFDWPPAMPVFPEKKNLDKLREAYRDPKAFTAAPSRVDAAAIIVFDPLPGDGDKEKLFFKKLFDKLQSSAEGRRIVEGLAGEYTLSGMKLRVQLADFPGSTVVVNKDGVEEIGGRARAYSFPASGLYKLNKVVMQFKDQDAALRDAAANAGHELTHIRNLAELKRRTRGAYTSVWSYDVRDELEARVEGWIVATELGTKGRPNVYSEEIRGYLDDPAGYLKDFGTAPSYADSFDGAGMGDPIGSLKKRVDGVQSRIADLKDDLPTLKFLSWAVEHLKTAHGASGLDDVRDTIDDELQTYASLKSLQAAQARLSSAGGAAVLAQMKRAAADPEYNMVPARLTEILGRLKAALKRTPPPPAPPERKGQLTMAQFRAQVASDRKAHPEHWRDAPPLAQ